MKKPVAIQYKILAFLAALAVLNFGCDLADELARALARLCDTPEYVVTRFDDPRGGLCGPTNCSLRQAITISNACTGTQSVRIPAGTYTLSLAGAGEDVNLTGDLDITDSVNIIGVGNPVIDANHLDRVLDVHTPAVLDLAGVIIQNGDASVDYVEGHGIIGGGGIRSREGTELHIHSSTIRNNDAGVHGSVTGSGGGIQSWSRVVAIDHSQITANNGGSGGIYVYANTGTTNFTLDNTSVSNNTGVIVGGVEIFGGDVNATFTDFVIDENIAPSGIGGVENHGTSLTMTRGEINRNRNTVDHSVLGSVGGMINFGRLTATQVSINGNTGGGLFNSNTGTANISHSAIIDNVATSSGDHDHPGLVNIGQLTVDNSTISANRSGGLWNYFGAQAELIYTTIGGNGPFGIRRDDGQVKLYNSIVAGTEAGPNCNTTTGIVSEGFNLDSGHSCGFSGPSDLSDLDPLLGSPALNGGTTFTQALALTSPAVDSADPARCGGTDQRGRTRPSGPGCDRGAYEVDQQNLPARSPTPTPSKTPEPTEAPTGATSMTLDKNAFCRYGPGVVYPTLTGVLAGQSVQLIGRNQDGTWYYSIIPGNFKCWISSGTGTPDGDPNGLPVLVAPPTPTPTITPKPSATPKPNSVIDFDQDGYPANKDCNDKNAKIHPGAPETPDDKVDSNCNGDDDK